MFVASTQPLVVSVLAPQCTSRFGVRDYVRVLLAVASTGENLARHAFTEISLDGEPPEKSRLRCSKANQRLLQVSLSVFYTLRPSYVDSRLYF
ncbi:hypothetical protein PC118_g9534 [Phytophthora cactorum]|uniref:Uncharacterized protein n=1 Tax=Phytophthora cactorum TaxID=29920 RepID=A0A8T1G4E5_9STRA|nr:hypothetical protein PC118_g9534 [Phytophthora cactorum]